jgi:hypothetical protein
MLPEAQPEAQTDAQRVIDFKERVMAMVKEDVVLRGPMRILGRSVDELLPSGHFGAVVARAGVGKTAFLIQIAMDYLIRGKNVLHVGLKDPVDKVTLWYKEVFRNATANWSRKQSQELWDALLPHRFIMTFRAQSFSVPTLEERLSDLSEQGVFIPDAIVIDGFDFTEPPRDTLLKLKSLVENHSLCAWFTVRTHRHEPPGADGIPVQLSGISDLFTALVELQPAENEVQVKSIKGVAESEDLPKMFLDPSTLLVKSVHSHTP